MTELLDLPRWIRSVMALDPSMPAVQFEGHWRPWEYLAGLDRELDAVLSARGVGEGSPVGVVMRNRPEIVASVAALVASRRCIVTLSSAIPTAALAADVERLALPVVIAGAGDWEALELVAAARAAGSLAVRVADGTEVSVEIAAEGDPERLASHPKRPGVAVQMLTSGTTGPPKRIDLLYRSLEHELVSTARYSSTGDMSEPRLARGVSILWAPLLHIGGFRGLISGLAAGRPLAVLERFDVARWAELVHEHRPKAISLPPAGLRMVLDAKVPKEMLASARAVFVGTAPMAPELGEEFERAYGIPALVVYGATEFAGGVAGWTLADWERYGSRKRGSVGRANAGVDVRVVDPGSGEALPPGGKGLLEVRSVQLASDGWVRTTDLATIDDDGFIWIVGRVDDVIIRGGFKVSTTAVREVLAQHPKVYEASVIGLPDDRLGQIPVAAVELVPGAATPPSGSELREYLRGKLAAYQVPAEIKVVDQLPRTPSMKVSQPGVRALFS